MMLIAACPSFDWYNYDALSSDSRPIYAYMPLMALLFSS